MIWKDVQSHWTAFVPNVLSRWPDLDEDEVLDTDGDRAAFSALLAETQKMGPSVADGEIADWLMGMQPADAIMDDTRDNERIRAAAGMIHPGEDVYSDDAEFGDDGIAPQPITKTG